MCRPGVNPPALQTIPRFNAQSDLHSQKERCNRLTALKRVGKFSVVERFIDYIRPRVQQLAELLYSNSEALLSECARPGVSVPKDLAQLLEQFETCVITGQPSNYAALSHTLWTIAGNKPSRISTGLRLLFALEDTLLQTSAEFSAELAIQQNGPIDEKYAEERAAMLRVVFREALCAFAEHLPPAVPLITGKPKQVEPPPLPEEFGTFLPIGSGNFATPFQTTPVDAPNSSSPSAYSGQVQEMVRLYNALPSNGHQIIAVSAPAAFGKTCLIQNFLGRLRMTTPKHVVERLEVSICTPVSVPGSAWGGILRTLLNAPWGCPQNAEHIGSLIDSLLDEATPELRARWKPRLSDLRHVLVSFLDGPLDSELWITSSFCRQLIRASYALIEACAHRAQKRSGTNFLLILEDVDEIDSFSWTVFYSVMTKLSREIGITIVLSAQSQEKIPTKFHKIRDCTFREIVLGTRSQEVQRNLLDSLPRAAGISRNVANLIIEAAEGSPTRLRAIYQRLLNSGADLVSGRGVSLESLKGMLTFDHVRNSLSSDAKTALEMIAAVEPICGGPCIEAVADTIGLPRNRLLRAINDLKESGICTVHTGESGISARLAHPDMRALIESEMSPERSRQLHDAIGEWFALLQPSPNQALIAALHLVRGASPESALLTILDGVDQSLSIEEFESAERLSNIAVAVHDSTVIEPRTSFRMFMQRDTLFLCCNKQEERRIAINRLQEYSNALESTDRAEIALRQACFNLQTGNLDAGISMLSKLSCIQGGDDITAAAQVGTAAHILLSSDPQKARQSLTRPFGGQNDIEAIINDDLQSYMRRGRARHALALVHLKEGRRADAMHHAFEAWRIFCRIGAVVAEALVIRTLAIIFWEDGHLTRADHLLKHAYDLLHTSKVWTDRESARISFDHGRLCIQQSDPQSALNAFEDVEFLLRNVPEDRLLKLEAALYRGELLIEQEAYVEATDKISECVKALESKERPALEAQRIHLYTAARIAQCNCICRQPRDSAGTINLALSILGESLETAYETNDTRLIIKGLLIKLRALISLARLANSPQKAVGIKQTSAELLKKAAEAMAELDRVFKTAFESDQTLISFRIEIELMHHHLLQAESNEAGALQALKLAYEELKIRSRILQNPQVEARCLKWPFAHKELSELAEAAHL